MGMFIFLQSRSGLAGITSRLILGLAIVLAAGLFVPVAFGGNNAVQAQNFNGICDGLRDVGDNCDPPGQAVSESKINTLVNTALQIFSEIVGIVSVLMILYGGFRYITAGGDSSKISTAQQTIIYAIVGLVVAGLAQVISRFVLNKAVNG